METPLISIVMPVYNCSAYLREAIESILDQSFKDFEFIIINDGSTDNSKAIIKEFCDSRIRYFEHSNVGVAASLNIGIAVSRSDYIARFDGDDIAKKERLEKQYNYLEKHKDCVAVGAHIDIIDKDGNYLYTKKSRTNWEDIIQHLPRTSISHSVSMYRKKSVLECGKYNEKLLTAQDTLLFNQMATIGRLNNVDDVLLSYRLTPTSVSMRNSKERRIIHGIIDDIVKTRHLSEKNSQLLKKIYKRKRNKASTYYLRLGEVYTNRYFKRRIAFRNFVLSIFYNPFNYTSWVKLFFLVLPRKLALVINERKKTFLVVKKKEKKSEKSSKKDK
jgi:glycosyltransferase involved in cell wall biosynthesis